MKPTFIEADGNTGQRVAGGLPERKSRHLDGFVQWMLMGIPVSVVMLALLCYALPGMVFTL
ncbi:MAG: hypothetical protein SV598_07765 [Pseudomonadota bacterium]|nr:hypothetical protein [Pseudomonadota bacterium]